MCHSTPRWKCFNADWNRAGPMWRPETLLPLALMVFLATRYPLYVSPAVAESRVAFSNWGTMNANSNGTNHVEQSQVGPDNVNQLTKRWVFSIPPAPSVPGL